MDYKDITAGTMRNLATNSYDMEYILTLIKNRAEKGELELYLSDYYIADNVKKELELRGFHIEIGGRYNETNTLIKWK